MNNLEKARQDFDKLIEQLKDQEEGYWNSLTKEQQLLAFCAVIRRVYKGDVEDRGTYRYVLYDTFDFGPESYMRAQMAGYLTIHNLIYQGIETEDSEDSTSGEQT